MCLCTGGSVGFGAGLVRLHLICLFIYCVYIEMKNVSEVYENKIKIRICEKKQGCMEGGYTTDFGPVHKTEKRNYIKQKRKIIVRK